MNQNAEPGSEESVAILVHPDEYLKQLNQVASLTTRSIRLVKRKFVSKTGWEIAEIPLSDCTGILYRDERPLLRLFLAILLVALIAFIFYMVVVYWDRLDPGTRIPIGALGLAAIYGLRWAFGSRRHRLAFELKGGRTLVWKSASGDYKYKIASVQKIIEFARSTGLLMP